MDTFTLSPLDKNFFAWPTLVLKSFVSMLRERRISLMSTIFWFFFHYALVLARLLLPLGLLEAVLPVIQEFAHGRLRLRCDLHEVQIFFFRFCKRVARGHDAELAAVRVDDTHLSVANAFIDFHFFFAANRKAPPNVSVAAGAARL